MSGVDFAARGIALGTLARLGSTEVDLGSRLVGYRAPDYDSVGRNLVDRLDERISVKDFGAVGDGVTDDTEAIRAALRALIVRTPLFYGYRMGTGRLYLPEGVYRITQNGVFSNMEEWQRSNIVVHGAGSRNSILWLDPSALSGTSWFYENNGQRQWGMVFEDLSFSGGDIWHDAIPLVGTGIGVGNINPLCNGFKLTGPGWESGFIWSRCEFRYFETVFHVAGPNNVDTHTFIACTVNKCRNVNYIDNTQSVSHSWNNCYINLLYGNFLEYGPNCAGGGGNFLMHGGAIIAAQGSGDTSSHYVVKATAGGTSLSNAPITFSDVRMELRGNYHGFAHTNYGDTQIIARGCSFLNTGNADKTIVIVGGFSTVRFEATSFEKGTNGGNMLFQVGENGDGRRGKNAHLHFANGCQVDDALFSFGNNAVQWAGNGGRLTIDEDCRGSSVSDATASPRTYARGCDVFGPASLVGEGQAQNTRHRTRRRFEVSPFWTQTGIAGSGGLYGTAVQLPPYVRIAQVWVKIEAGVGNGNNFRCLIGNDDKSVIYATTVAKAQNAGHYVCADLHIPVESDSNTGRVRFWFDDGTGGASAGDSNIRVEGGVIY